MSAYTELITSYLALREDETGKHQGRLLSKSLKSHRTALIVLLSS
jgi:hypothetical protein